jgi:hypothetical protein
MTDWKDKLILNPGDHLRYVGESTRGSLQETDVRSYEILDGLGQLCGTVTLEDHTALNGFKGTMTVCQKDAGGKTVASSSWSIEA